MRAGWRALAGAVAGFPWLAHAAEATRAGADKLKDFGLAEGTAAPSFGRIIVVFLLLAAAAWGAAWLLRRYGARWRLAPVAGASPIRHVARSSLPGGVACHVVEAEGNRVLITVSRHGVSSIVLGAAPPPEQKP